MRRRTRLMVLALILLVFPTCNLSAQERWVYRYNGPGDDADGARSIVYGSDGDIYAAGYSRGTSTDFTVISLTSIGDTNWIYRYNGPVDATDDAYSIAYGSDGNLYVAGGSYFTVGRATDFTVISLTSSGSHQWVYQYDGGAGALDRAYSVCYGADGNVYAAGNCWAGGGDYWDFTIISLPPSGPPVNWIYGYDGPGSEMDNSDAAYSIVYGSDGNLYAAGKSYGNGTWRDFTVVSVTTSNTERWVYRYDGSANLDDVARSIIYGGDGNIYVAGYVRNDNNDMIVVSLPATGPPANWVYVYNGAANGDDAASSVSYGLDGNVYVAGSSTGSGTQSDFTIISLTTTAVERWVYTYNGSADSTDGASSIVYGSDNNIYAAGGSTDSLTGYDFTVIGLDTTGAERWVYRYNGPGDAYDVANSIVMGTDGNIYAAGRSEGSGTQDDFIVVSLAPEVGVEEKLANDHYPMTNYQLFQNFPNPFTRTTTIPFSLPPRQGDVATRRGRDLSIYQRVNLSVYDLAGRLVRILFDETLTTDHLPLTTAVSWDGKNETGREVSAGAYFYRLTSDNSSATKKLILLR